ncbi:MAG: hypothetical protein Kow00128_06870 [Deltaproteobacteria bacterium]
MRCQKPGPRRFPPILWGTLAGIVFFAVHPVGADEIRFRSGAVVREGTVLEEEGGTVTIRFPRQAIESISRGAGTPPGVEAGRNDSRMEERIRRLERKVESLASASALPDSGGKGGTVEGAIRWKNLPLSHARVLIVPRGVAGRPPAVAGANEAGAAGSPLPEGSFETRTDGSGQYRFERVPPGEYLLYWMPDEGGGWVRRLRDRADLVVSAGRTTVLNIPEERR